MDAENLLLVLAGLFVVAAIKVALQRRARIRGVAGVPRVEIAALEPGPRRVRIVGAIRAADGRSVSGPSSGKLGVAAVFERWSTAGPRRLDRQTRHVPLVVEDATGSIPIGHEHVELELELDRVELGGTGSTRAFGAGVIASNSHSRERHLEAVLAPGELVAVVGRAELGPAGTLQLVGTRAAPLVIVNHGSATSDRGA